MPKRKKILVNVKVRVWKLSDLFELTASAPNQRSWSDRGVAALESRLAQVLMKLLSALQAERRKAKQALQLGGSSILDISCHYAPFETKLFG